MSVATLTCAVCALPRLTFSRNRISPTSRCPRRGHLSARRKRCEQCPLGQRCRRVSHLLRRQASDAPDVLPSDAALLTTPAVDRWSRDRVTLSHRPSLTRGISPLRRHGL